MDTPIAGPVEDEKLEDELLELDGALAGLVEDCEFVDAVALKILELKVDAKILELIALVLVRLVRADVADDAPKVLVLVVRDVSVDG